MRPTRPKAALAAVLLVGVIGGISLHGCIAAPRYYGPTTDHFDGEKFKNEGPYEERNLWDVIKWKLTAERKEWPEWVDIAPAARPPERVNDGVRITFVNHATTLIQMGGLNILTDPIWSERTGPLSIGSSRHKAPGIAFADLPPIDVIVISHNHYDHLDIPTLARLAERGEPVLFAGLGTKRLLEKQAVEIRAVDLDWWQSKVIDGVRITFTPAQHWSTRVFFGDSNVNLWGSWYFSDGTHAIYFGGDTAVGPHFAQIKDRLGAPEVALLPIGAYEPRWFMKPQHLDPAEAVGAHLTLGAKRSVAIHWGTFHQTDEGIDDPKRELAIALAGANLDAESFVALENGENLTLP